MYINILQQAFEDGKRIKDNIERNKLISLWMDFPSKRCGWISIVDLTDIWHFLAFVYKSTNKYNRLRCKEIHLY